MTGHTRVRTFVLSRLCHRVEYDDTLGDNDQRKDDGEWFVTVRQGVHT